MAGKPEHLSHAPTSPSLFTPDSFSKNLYFPPLPSCPSSVRGSYRGRIIVLTLLVLLLLLAILSH